MISFNEQPFLGLEYIHLRWLNLVGYLRQLYQ
jgi:hypothetical protein